MEKAAIIDALSVTETNAAELIEIFSETLKDDNYLAGQMLKWLEHLDGTQSLCLLGKILMVTRFALCAGYTKALKDVQTVHRAELAAMEE